MTTFRKAVISAIVKSLLRGKSLIQAILAFWVSPLSVDPKAKTSVRARVVTKSVKTIQDFLKDAEACLVGPVSGEGLVELSARLKEEFYERLQNDVQSMLPSFSHQLPTGSESGQFLALDVGGSTLRVALVELKGRDGESEPSSEIVSMRNFSISRLIKDLKGMDFFDWMGARILEVVETGLNRDHSPENPLPMALAWSFPIEQTSLGGGKLQGMGKGFLANEGLLDRDLGEVVQMGCKKAGLNVELQVILNDSTACLLSQAYSLPSTRFGLILGTGVNIAAYLPSNTIGHPKFGVRPSEWFDAASHVIVNTELGMFGHGILPLTRWDIQLRDNHPRPYFQPLEYLVSGMYLGEICRYALIEAIESTGIFGGIVPPSLKAEYALATPTLSMIEADDTSDLQKSCELFAERHPSSHTPTTSDISALKLLASFISVRSSALVATSVYTLWDLRLESQASYLSSVRSPSQPHEEDADINMDKTMISFNGSVIENYPGYLRNCQKYINELVAGKGVPELGSIELVPAKESSLQGAAVALACVHNEA